MTEREQKIILAVKNALFLLAIIIFCAGVIQIVFDLVFWVVTNG